MSRYAIVENNIVVNIIEADEEFANEVGAIPSDTASIGDFYIDGVFSSPPPYVPTTEEVLATNTLILNSLTKQANTQVTAIQGRVDTINDAIDLDEALPSEITELPVVTALLKKWKSYRILLGRVTLQAGWPPEPVWPVVPELYITTTDSASSTATAETV